MRPVRIPLVAVGLTGLLVGLGAFASPAQAAFGISPPWVHAVELQPGQRFRAGVTLVRDVADAVQPIRARLVLPPDVAAWVSLPTGLEFEMPAGVRQFGVPIDVWVPPDASPGAWAGTVTFEACAPPLPGQVGICLGAQASITIRVTAEPVDSVRVLDARIGVRSCDTPFVLRLHNEGNRWGGIDAVALETKRYWSGAVMYRHELSALPVLAPGQAASMRLPFPGELAASTHPNCSTCSADAWWLTAYRAGQPVFGWWTFFTGPTSPCVPVPEPSFGREVSLSGGAPAPSVVVTDVDGDGAPDVVTTAPALGVVSVWRQRGGAFLGVERHVLDHPADVISLGDVDGDGRADIVTGRRGPYNAGCGCYPSSSIDVSLQQEGGSFGTAVSAGSGGALTDLTFADLDGVGGLEILSVSAASGELRAWRWGGAGALALLHTLRVGPRPTRVVAARLRPGGPIDAVVGDGTAGVAIALGRTDGGFAAPTMLGIGPTADVAVTDLDRDGVLDVAATTSSPDISVFAGQGDGSVSMGIPVEANYLPRRLAFGDFDGNDGRDVVYATNSPHVGLLRERAPGFLARATGWTLPDRIDDLQVADLDGDGRDDLVALLAGDGRVLVRLTSARESVPPEVSCEESDGLWHADNVSVWCTATDAGSGLANATDDRFSLSTTVEPGAETAQAWTDARDVCDRDGNCTTAGPVGGHKVDRRPPVVEITTAPPPVAVIDSEVTFAYSCADDGSGVSNCTGSVPAGAPLDAGTVGDHVAWAMATDAVGNATRIERRFQVTFGVDVLFDQARSVRSGRVLPVRVRLVGASGRNLSSDQRWVRAVRLVHVSSNAATQVEDPGDANPDGNFRYDGDLAGYIFNLSTRGLATGTYQLVFVAAEDPVEHVVLVQVR